LPISWIRPGFSRGGGDGTGAPCGDAGSGAGVWTTEVAGAAGGEAACGQATSPANINIAAPAAATCILDDVKRLPDRSSMTSSVA
jgi:hypothetical protein